MGMSKLTVNTHPEYNNFINVMIEASGDDPSNYHMYTTLYSLKLVSVNGSPLPLAIDLGLPENTELAKYIARVAVCKDAEETRQDWVRLARYRLSECDPYSADTMELEACIKRTVNDVKSWHISRLEAYSKAMELINK